MSIISQEIWEINKSTNLILIVNFASAPVQMDYEN